MATISDASATLVGIPDELILAIGILLQHPPDILHLTCVCRHIHRLTVPLLYKNITFNNGLYSESPHYTDAERLLGRAQPYLAIKRLTRSLANDKTSAQSRISANIRTLTLRVPSNIDLLCFGLGSLL